MDAATGSLYTHPKMNHGQVMHIARDCSIGSLLKPQKIEQNQSDNVADMRRVWHHASSRYTAVEVKEDNRVGYAVDFWVRRLDVNVL